MSTSSALFRLLRVFAPATFLFFALAVAPRLAASVAADDIIPANLVGKTFTFAVTGTSPGGVNIEPAVTGYSVQFTSATNYVRSGPGVTSEGGTYTVLTSVDTPLARVTGIQINNNWLAPGNNTTVLLSLTVSKIVVDTGVFSVNEILNPARLNGGTFDLRSSGGGTTTPLPAVTAPNTLTATAGTAFSYQVVATNSPTRYAATGLPAGLAINATTGLISGTPTGSAGTSSITVSATNAGGTTTVTIVFTVAAGSGTGGGTPAGTPATAAAAWGWNLSGQTTLPGGLNSVVMIAGGGQHSLALKSDGTVVSWGSTNTGLLNVPAGLTGVTAITAASFHSVALKSDGSVVMWGDSTPNGQRTGFPTNNSGFTAISAKYFHTLAVKSDGTVVVWGTDPAFGLPTVPAGLTGVKAVAAGLGYDLALKTDGTVVGWASPKLLSSTADYKGQIAIPAGLSGVVAIAAGQYHALALKSDGSVVAWGGFRTGTAAYTVPVAAQSGVIAISCGLEHSLVLKSTGAVVGWGNPNSFGEANVPTSVTTATRIAAGEYFSLALTGGTAPAAGFIGGNPGGGTVAPAQDSAPTNLVGYRNKVGQTFQFNVTGASAGAVWGTDVYTDDSSVARAAVHAGVVAVGETKTVTITILGGQSSYAASSRNGVTTLSWPSWPGSYAFAGATGATATAKPVAASGFTTTTASLAVGGRLVLPVTVTGGGNYFYQWYFNNIAISGATANPYVIESLTVNNAGAYTVDVTNTLGTTRITAGTITVGAAGSPVIALQPLSKVAAPGATVTFATSATGSGLLYQWFRNGVAIAGETGAIILRQNVNANDAGTYTVRITNNAGSVTSAGGVLSISPDASRPANISVRTNVATGTTVIPGFVIQGTGTKRVLIRAVGPGLGAFGLTGVMADPKLTLFQGSTKMTENDDWSAANIGTAFTGTGAFALPANSKDAALVTDLAAGLPYSVVVTNASGTGGIVLIEVYDADALKGSSTSKLVNVSVRGQTGPGADVLTLGLVIGGTGQRTLLVRGVGPSLAAFGVTGTLPDPRIQIVDSQQRAILANDDWGNADFVNELAVATNYVGAFALGANSKDAATLSLIDPGAYTIQVSGGSTAPTGEALVEVYEVP